ncbi:MAG: outer membrane lipoprotein LolB [SAR86 cluster bacterium]|uniref:Outer-membrane lipoprotein LolB n=1 Tax=SAR86 cluster bacterium TaxID=2030880 RepID=A0A2A5CFI6_9GAMM|nr:outer membrane lipoprotein LolB [Gammaproteobacteria bacterium AH-315-E17]PCJ42629.1 MAG: outer membrane lipoprotein LolB [SAR86 cluster bacterium]
MLHFIRSARTAYLLAISLLLVSCTTSNTLVNRDWQVHQALVTNTHYWTLQGRLNIRQANNSDTVSINWQQIEQDFEINLSGALGIGATMISGNQNGIRLQQGNDNPIEATNLAELSRDYLGYEFPAEALHYWVRGIPSPHSTATMEFNENQLLASLKQRDAQGNNWQLEYDRYQDSDGLSLPGRIRMTHPDYRLTFIIQSWQTRPGGN